MPAEEAAAFLAAIVESSDDAIVGKALDGTVLSWNAGAERMFGWTEEEMCGASVRRLIPAERQQEEDDILAAIASGHRVPNFETVRLRKDGSLVHVSVTVSPVRDATGRIVAASKIAHDITATKHVHARLEDSEQRFRMLADNIAQLAWIGDSSGGLFWYNRRWFDFTGTTLDQMLGWGWTTVHHPDHIERVTALWQQHLASGNPWEDTFPLRGADGEYRWFLSRAVPLHDPQGNIVYWFGTNTDITAMRDAEQRIELLMMEVNHRSKNMLAVIQALARRTASQGGDFIPRLEARIHAISANQDLLVNRSWSSVPVREMIDTQLGMLGEAIRQVDRVGPEVMLSPAAAESMAMAIHEMATNAVKFGALCVPDGQVRVAWSLEPGADGEMFAIHWSESGGPEVAPPEVLGFGSRIIDDVPRSKLSAAVSTRYQPDGFNWSLRCPLANVAPRRLGPVSASIPSPFVRTES